ncbi:hypothetical protein P4B35_06010 [Pontiellaceae bacterium B12227]|nr:hypothetical protein [Pontiellaceae bacterium B12227]
MINKISYTLAICLAGVCGAQAANIHWSGGAGTADWNDAGSWSTAYVPGATQSDTALFIGSGDNTTLVAPFTFTNSSSINLRGEPTVTLSADLSGVSSFLLGGNGNNTGGFVNQTAGTLSATSLRVGSSSTATSFSGYTLSGGSIVNSGELYVNMGTLLLENNVATVSADSMRVTGIGTLAFELGTDGVNAIDVANNFLVEATAKLSIDASGLTAGEGDYELLSFGSYTRAFQSENVTISGLADGLSGSITYDADSMNLTVIPEPATLGLIASFGGGLLFVRRLIQL